MKEQTSVWSFCFFCKHFKSMEIWKKKKQEEEAHILRSCVDEFKTRGCFWKKEGKKSNKNMLFLKRTLMMLIVPTPTPPISTAHSDFCNLALESKKASYRERERERKSMWIKAIAVLICFNVLMLRFSNLKLVFTVEMKEARSPSKWTTTSTTKERVLSSFLFFLF